MPGFAKEIREAAAAENEVTLTTRGRVTGTQSHVTLWVSTDGRRIFIRSGGGLSRHWPQNLTAAGTGVLRLGRHQVEFAPRHVTDPEEARSVSHLVRKKYGAYVTPSKPGEPLTQGEQATFELIPLAPKKRGLSIRFRRAGR
ncbi:MAG: nitroreductase/quinone reductase family protein [Candidatus Dormibacterales bacterium]